MAREFIALIMLIGLFKFQFSHQVCRLDILNIIGNTGDQSAFLHRHSEPRIGMKESKYAFESMNPKKAPGGDHLTADICLQCFSASPALFYELFNRCFQLEYFPVACKVAQIVLIPKPSLEGRVTNEVRPIGLLPVSSKVF